MTPKPSWASEHLTDDVAVNPALPVLRALRNVALSAVPTMLMADPDVDYDVTKTNLEHLQAEQHVGKLLLALIRTLVDTITVYDNLATAWRRNQDNDDS
jgi:hypothetical protein